MPEYWFTLTYLRYAGQKCVLKKAKMLIINKIDNVHDIERFVIIGLLANI